MNLEDQDPSAQDNRRKNASKDSATDFSSLRHHIHDDELKSSRAKAASKVFSKGLSAASAHANFIENFVSKMFSVTKVGAAMFVYLLADLCYTRYSASSFNFSYVRLLLATVIHLFFMFLPKLAFHYQSVSHSMRAESKSEPMYLRHILTISVSLLFYPFLIIPLSDKAVKLFAPVFVPYLDADWFIRAFPVDKASSTEFILGFSSIVPALNAIWMISFTALNLQLRSAVLAYHLTFVAMSLVELQTASVPLIIIHHIAIFASSIELPVLQERILPMFASLSISKFTENCEWQIPCRHRQITSSPNFSTFLEVFVGKRFNCYRQLSKLLRLSAHFFVVACILSITNVSFYLLDMHSSVMLVYPLSFFSMAFLHAAPHIVLKLFGSSECQKKCLCDQIRVPYFWSIISVSIIIMCRFMPLTLNSMLVNANPFDMHYHQDELFPILLSAYLPCVLLNFNAATLRPVGWFLFNVCTYLASTHMFATMGNTLGTNAHLRIILVNLIGVFTMLERFCSQCVCTVLLSAALFFEN